MSTVKCRSALDRLLAFEAGEMRVEVVAELVRLAAAFAEGLSRAGGGEELRRRAAEFEALTADGSPFEAARLAAHAELSGPGARFYLPDFYFYRRHSLEGPRSVEGRKTRYPNYLNCVRDRLAHREWAQWYPRAALEDAEAILRVPLSPKEDKEVEGVDDPEGRLRVPLSAEQEQLFGSWKDALWDFITRCEGEHLFGAYLLAACQKATAPGRSDRAGYTALLRRLAEGPADPAEGIRSRWQVGWPRATLADGQATVTGVIQEAAEDLFLSAGQLGSTPPPASVPRKDWCHPETDPIPAEFMHDKPNPGTLKYLVGTLKYLAELICPLYQFELDTRALKRLGRSHTVWIQQVSGQCYKAYFRKTDQKNYAEANDADMKRKEKEQAQKAQKPAK
jgi:hypothetical protein